MTTTELPRPGDQETSETRGQGDKGTRSNESPLLVSPSPHLPISPSPPLPLSLSPLHLALAYLAALTIAEVLTALFEPRVGLVLHGILLVILLLHTALTWEHPSHGLLLSLAFAPLIRLLSLSLPLAGVPLVYWYFITSVPLFVAAVIVLRTLRFSWAGIGLNLRALPVQLLVSLTGLAFGYIEYQILEPEPLARAFTWEQLWVPALILLVSTGFVEEVIFRGVMQRAATEALGRFGVLYVAILFAVLHVGYKSLLDVLFVFGVALFFGWVVARTRSILGVTLSHGLTNIMLFLVVPLLPVFNPAPAPLAPGMPLPLLATSTPAVPVPVTPTVGPTMTPTATVPKPTPTPTSSRTASPAVVLTATPVVTPIQLARTEAPVTETPTIVRALGATATPTPTPTPGTMVAQPVPPQMPATATPTALPTPEPTATLEPAFLTAEVTITERCWLHVEVDGQLVLEGILLAGESRTWQAGREIYLWIGNAGGIAVVINGEDQGILGEHAQVVHRTWTLEPADNYVAPRQIPT